MMGADVAEADEGVLEADEGAVASADSFYSPSTVSDIRASPRKASERSERRFSRASRAVTSTEEEQCRMGADAVEADDGALA